jgi:hypothetical protein
MTSQTPSGMSTSVPTEQRAARTSKRLRGVSVSAAAAAALVLPVATPAEAANSTAVSAYVVCPGGQQVEGLYVKANNGSYWGWASWAAQSSNGTARFTFSANAITDVTLAVGCGGSRQQWANSYPAYVAVTRAGSMNFTINCATRTYPSCAAF